jgi:hypothetical protein
MALTPRLITSPWEAPKLLGLAFAIQILLQDLANIKKDMAF